MDIQEVISIGNELEAVEFHVVRKDEPRKICFAQGSPEEVAPIIQEVALEHNVPREEVAMVALGVRAADELGVRFQDMTEVIQELDEKGLLQLIIGRRSSSDGQG